MDQLSSVSIATLLGKEARYIHDTPVHSVRAKNYRVVDSTIVTQRQVPMIREVQRTFEIPVYPVAATGPVVISPVVLPHLAKDSHSPTASICREIGQG